MRNRSTPALPSAAPRQLSMGFESVKLLGMSPTEHSTALAQLAALFLEAAGAAAPERDDDER